MESALEFRIGHVVYITVPELRTPDEEVAQCNYQLSLSCAVCRWKQAGALDSTRWITNITYSYFKSHVGLSELVKL